jgi:hypothetical protein
MVVKEWRSARIGTTKQTKNEDGESEEKGKENEYDEEEVKEKAEKILQEYI